MKKVFVVTSGEYSDYGIDSIFSTKELAEKFIESFNQTYRNMSIEEWTLDPSENAIQTNKKAFWLRIDKDGNTRDLEWCDSAYGFRGETPSLSWTGDKVWLNIYVFANDDKHAVKIANEIRSQVIALNLWGNNLDTLSAGGFNF